MVRRILNITYPLKFIILGVCYIELFHLDRILTKYFIIKVRRSMSFIYNANLNSLSTIYKSTGFRRKIGNFYLK